MKRETLCNAACSNPSQEQGPLPSTLSRSMVSMVSSMHSDIRKTLKIKLAILLLEIVVELSFPRVEQPIVLLGARLCFPILGFALSLVIIHKLNLKLNCRRS